MEIQISPDREQACSAWSKGLEKQGRRRNSANFGKRAAFTILSTYAGLEPLSSIALGGNALEEPLY
jgi:hypothetical protein